MSSSGAREAAPGSATRYVPIEAIGFTAIITAIFAVYIPHTVTGAPAYARITLLVVAVNNLLRALNHWLSLPDGGLESGTRLFLGPPTAVRAMAIGLRRKEGQALCWYSCILIYISYYAPEHTFVALKIQLLRVVLAELTELSYAPFHFRGRSLLENSPEEYGFTVDMCMVTFPLVYAYLMSDL
jgi:hypothetical protein